MLLTLAGLGAHRRRAAASGAGRRRAPATTLPELRAGRDGGRRLQGRAARAAGDFHAASLRAARRRRGGGGACPGARARTPAGERPAGRAGARAHRDARAAAVVRWAGMGVAWRGAGGRGSSHRTPCTLQTPYKKTGSNLCTKWVLTRTIEWRNRYPRVSPDFSPSSTQSAGVPVAMRRLACGTSGLGARRAHLRLGCEGSASLLVPSACRRAPARP